MKLKELPDGEAVFVDANIFIYHFTGVSEQCRDFVKRCSQKQLSAFTSTTVLAEVCHRLMAVEAVHNGLVKTNNPSAYLRKNPLLVMKLSQYFTQITNIMAWNIEVIPAQADIVIKSQIYRERYGLLTNDSFIPIYMEELGTVNLASADKDFARIPHLKAYMPSDMAI